MWRASSGLCLALNSTKLLGGLGSTLRYWELDSGVGKSEFFLAEVDESPTRTDIFLVTLAIKDELDELVPDLGLDSKQLNEICRKYFQKRHLEKVFYLFEFTQR